MPRRFLTAVLFIAFLVVTARAQQLPRLLVIIVVDQFRADYLDTFSTHWTGGFKTLLSEGAVFRRAAYPYLHTDTCAGHFTISTGTLPRTHGMVADNVWDRDSAKLIECTDDEASPTLTYGRPARLGKSARSLLVPTLADELRTQQARTRVVTLSMKARGAIGLAGHGGDAVTWFEETPGVMAFVTARAFSPRLVPAVNAFLKRDPHDKEFGAIWNLRDAPETYHFRDAGAGERPPTPWTGLFPHSMKTEGTSDVSAGLWRGSPLSDAYLGRMGVALADAFGLGRRDVTDFLGISFSATDFVGHAFGPESREVEDNVARLDDALGSVIAYLDAKVGRANYVLALSADHGGAPIPVTREAGRVASEDIRDRIEETLRTHVGPIGKTSYVIANYVENMYLAAGVMDRLRSQPSTMEAVEQAVMALPGVARLLRADQLSETSSDPVVRAAALSRMPGRSGDLVVIAKPYWMLTGRNSTNATGHGTSYDYDQQVPLILFGAGIKAGQFDNAATPADIAPTLARLAQVQMRKAEGRVLQEALR